MTEYTKEEKVDIELHYALLYLETGLKNDPNGSALKMYVAQAIARIEDARGFLTIRPLSQQPKE